MISEELKNLKKNNKIELLSFSVDDKSRDRINSIQSYEELKK
jgi:hypothetical protein